MKTLRMMRNGVLPAIATIAVLLLMAAPASAYQSYHPSNPDNGCVQCHGGFVGGPGNPLHSMHVGGSQMTNNCNLCHGPGFASPKTNTSAADPNHGCNGCHMGPGLRLSHAGRTDNNGLQCITCHPSDPTPPPENTLPPYYSRTDVNLSQPCAIGRANGGEDYSGNGKGLDNDGDGVYDFNDTDCFGVKNEENSWGAIKSGYGRPWTDGSR